MTIRILVADTTRARVFTADTPKGALVEMFDLVNPEARLHERDLTSDLSGRAQSSATGMSSSYGIEEKHKPEAVRRFARQIAERLEQDRGLGEFDKLYIVAERAFLGDLRRVLDDNTTAVLAGTVNKNLTRNPLPDIRSALPDFL
jgi:protein required for attachment to host cells